MAVSGPDEEVNDIDENQVERSNITTDQDHGNHDNHGGVPKLFVTTKSLFIGIPWPCGLGEFTTDFGGKSRNFCKHGCVILGKCQML